MVDSSQDPKFLGVQSPRQTMLLPSQICTEGKSDSKDKPLEDRKPPDIQVK